jgi:hypothetical protein
MVTAGLAALVMIALADAAEPNAAAPGPGAAPPAPTDDAPASSAPAPASSSGPAAEPALAPLPPPVPPPALSSEPPPPPRRYGDQGSIELGAGLTYSSDAGFAAAGSARYFLVDAVAPGVEATFVAGRSAASRYGLLLGALRIVPLRFNSFALALTFRAGRAFLGDHPDGWGIGGSASGLFMVSPTVGLELGYEALRLYPTSFCADLDGCTIRGPIIGVRFGF